METEFKIKIVNPINGEEILTFTTNKYIINQHTISFKDRTGKFFEYPITLFRGAEENKKKTGQEDFDEYR